jgi:hypothetical protein
MKHGAKVMIFQGNHIKKMTVFKTKNDGFSFSTPRSTA